jgi:hypothetical protein
MAAFRNGARGIAMMFVQAAMGVGSLGIGF